MGYVRRSTVLRLVFADPEFKGLEVRVRRVNLGQLIELTGYADLDPGRAGARDLSRITGLIDTLAENLLSWNLEEEVLDGTTAPVPATRDGLLSQDPDLVFAIVKAWMRGAGGVPGPLGTRSPGGDQSLEASIPTETLSPSPAA